MREETKYIVIHCSQTRPSQRDVDARTIDRWHRERGWLKIGYGGVILRDGAYEQGREDNEVQAHVKGYNHTSFGLCLVGGALEENWKLQPETLDEYCSTLNTKDNIYLLLLNLYEKRCSFNSLINWF